MDSLRAQTVKYQQERAGDEARMRQPQNMDVLERSQFLNALFAHKSFSWTAVMMDLERVLPGGVQVTSIAAGDQQRGRRADTAAGEWRSGSGDPAGAQPGTIAKVSGAAACGRVVADGREG